MESCIQEVDAVKLLTLLTWVTQFGLSALLPLCGFLLLGSWLQSTWELGMWIMVLCGILGFLTSVSTVRSCIRAMRRDADAAGSRKEAPVAFNDHD